MNGVYYWQSGKAYCRDFRGDVVPFEELYDEVLDKLEEMLNSGESFSKIAATHYAKMLLLSASILRTTEEAEVVRSKLDEELKYIKAKTLSDDFEGYKKYLIELLDAR